MGTRRKLNFWSLHPSIMKGACLAYQRFYYENNPLKNSRSSSEERVRWVCVLFYAFVRIETHTHSSHLSILG
jgi:hypothetical protein